MKRLGPLSIDISPLERLTTERDGVDYYTCMVHTTLSNQTSIMLIPVVVFDALTGPCSTCPAEKPQNYRTTFYTPDGHIRETLAHRNMTLKEASMIASTKAKSLNCDDYSTEPI